jgi:hypothetical protein
MSFPLWKKWLPQIPCNSKQEGLNQGERGESFSPLFFAMTILNLGRIGDNINLLPVLYSEHLAGRRPTIVTSGKYSDLFDGVSYCDVKRYSGDPVELSNAIGLCQGLPDLRVAQVFMHPNETRRESTYTLESYRLGRFRDLWRKFPYVIDQRDPTREQKLLENIEGPFIGVASLGVSSPFANSEQLINGLRLRFPDHTILDLSKVKAERIYDLLGILDRASCLVTIDTAHLWLANVAKCPTVALVNDGWRGSPPPVTATSTFRYWDFQLDSVCDEVEKTLLGVGDLVGIVDRFGQEKRHSEALESQKRAFTTLLTTQGIGRTAQSIGDPRPLPMLKDMLTKAIKFSRGRDTIVWTNDDVTILNLDLVKDHVGKFGAVGIRRDPDHIGRELFAFRWDWLADRLFTFPDCAVASPWFDLAVASWIRREFGWTPTLDNLGKDFYPCEIPNDGIFIHPPHESSWVGDKERYPAAQWNHHIFKQLIK